MLSQLASLYAYFREAPQAGVATVLPAKTMRHCTAFKSNVTASIALPDATCQRAVAPLKARDVASPPVGIGHYLAQVQALLFGTTSSTKNMKSHQVGPDTPVMGCGQSPMPDLSVGDAAPAMLEIEQAAELIKEHAARRVDLFFYLLLAVHGKQVTISKDKTIKQHGKGSRERGTAACHSALFPHVKLDGPKGLLALVGFYGKVSLEGTYFAEALNMTMELPSAVNAFDAYLEGRSRPTRYTQTCLALLNQTAQGELTPRAAMDQFLQILHDFFSFFEPRYVKRHHAPVPAALRRILALEQAGTVLAANPDGKSVSDEYLTLMLRLRGADKLTVKLWSGAWGHYYKKIQEEVLSHQAVVGHQAVGARPSE